MFNFYVWKQEFFVTIMQWRTSGEGRKHSTRFSRFLLFKPAASNMQKINPVGCYIFVSEGLSIHIYFLLFEENQNRISRAGEKISPTISLFFRKMIA